MSFLQSLLGSWTGSTRRRQDLADVLLMAGLADGALDQRDLDRIARAIERRKELAALEWHEVLSRAEELTPEAPAFETTRARIAASITDPEARRFALSLAVQFLGQPLAEAERELLLHLADDLDIEGAERDELLTPWSELDPLSVGYRRAELNNPERLRDDSIFEAIAHCETDVELGLLTFKLAAARSAMTALSEEAQLITLGEIITLDLGRFRVDAFIRAGEQNWIARFLAPDEALHPGEHTILAGLLERLDPSVSLFLGYAGQLAPPDAALAARLETSRARIEKLSV